VDNGAREGSLDLGQRGGGRGRDSLNPKGPAVVRDTTAVDARIIYAGNAADIPDFDDPSSGATLWNGKGVPVFQRSVSFPLEGAAISLFSDGGPNLNGVWQWPDDLVSLFPSAWYLSSPFYT
jgi:hypothetical protein